MALKGIILHGTLLALSVALAAYGWLKEDDPAEKHEAELWGGEAAQIESIAYESPQRKVLLQAQTDAAGRYWIGDVDKVKEAPADSDPHAALKPKEDKPEERERVRFVGVTEAEALAAKLAPLRAKRALGMLDAARLVEFGFDAAKPQILRLQVAGKQHELVVGGATPGASDSYVRLGMDGPAFVLSGNWPSDMNSAETRLVQRALVTFEPDEVAKVKLSAGDASREVARLPDKRDAWADPADLTKKDETISNWMLKFERLRITDYVEKLEAEPSPIVRADYSNALGKNIGFVELASVAGETTPTYYARSAHSRWWGTVTNTTAEQLAQDVKAVITP
jgi:hypothetical protein